ncbi:MAG: LPS export ABC transporter periplasmic protein LptC [Gammaproteobacteria bacterium]
MNDVTVWMRNSLLLLAVCLTSWQVFNIVYKQPYQMASNEYYADSFADSVHTKDFDEKGLLVKQLITKNFVHYPMKNTFFFQSPQILLHKNNQLIWRITADEGRSEYNNKEVQFTHHVHLEQPTHNNKSATHIHTEALTYYPKKHRAETNESLQLTQPGISLKSQGMTMDFITQRINLLAHAQGTYLPQEAPPYLNKHVKHTLDSLHHV